MDREELTQPLPRLSACVEIFFPVSGPKKALLSLLQCVCLIWHLANPTVISILCQEGAVFLPQQLERGAGKPVAQHWPLSKQ